MSNYHNNILCSTSIECTNHMFQTNEHGYVKQTKRRLVQDTKKLNCSAVIQIREVIAFPSHEVITDLLMK